MEPGNRSGCHVCPVHGCVVIMPNHLLMCSAHWKMVPTALKSEVTRAYNLRFQEGTDALREAQKRATESVNRIIKGEA